MIRVALHHRTEYHYDRPVTLSPHVVRLRPAPHTRTPIISYSLRVEPADHFINWQQDPQSNFLARLDVPESHRAPGGRGRSGGRHDGHQPVRLLPRARRTNRCPSGTRRDNARNSAPFLACRSRGATPLRVRGGGAAVGRAHDRFSRRPEPAGTAADRLPDPARAGRADERRDARTCERLMPRLGMAAGRNAPASGPGRALCLGLPDPAEARRKTARWPSGPAGRLHGSPRVDGGLPARRRMGRSRSRPRACSPAKATSRWPPRPTRKPRRRCRAW